MFLKISFLLVILASFASSSRILFVFPSPSESHLIVVKSLSTHLAERGHDVTVVSPFPLKKPMKNYRDIKVDVPQDMLDMNSAMVKKSNEVIWKSFPRLLKNLFEMSNNMLNTAEFKKLMKEEKFDLVVIGMFFNNHLLGIGDHFKCPTAMLSVSGAQTFINVLTGNPLAVSSVPHIFFQTKLDNFWGRLKNFIAHGADFLMIAYLEKLQKENYELNFPSARGYISFEEAQKNLSLVLLNSHFSQGGVRPYVPAMIEVGGLQNKPHPDALPEKLQAWLDGGSKNGVVFFSLGSNAKTTFLSREKIDVLLKVFGKLAQRVVMKWESDELEGKPDNVLIGKWLPQDSLLAHPNLKAFISHCGLGSVAEAKYHGVPIVGIPIGIDQKTNVDSIIAEGWAEKVDFINLNEEDLLKTIKKVVENPKYASRAKDISKLYRDRPMDARDTATFWIEYVIRHRGAPHLRYPGADLNFWQSKSIDVVLFLIASIYIVFKIVIVTLKICFSMLFGLNKKSKKIKKS